MNCRGVTVTEFEEGLSGWLLGWQVLGMENIVRIFWRRDVVLECGWEETTRGCHASHFNGLVAEGHLHIVGFVIVLWVERAYYRCNHLPGPLTGQQLSSCPEIVLSLRLEHFMCTTLKVTPS